MSERSVTHATFVIERDYDASPAHVFRAWADPAIKLQWFGGPGENDSDYALDFRVGGREHASGGPEGGPVFSFDAVYHDIVENERIVTTYEMHMDAARISVSVATMELRAAGTGTHMTYTELGAFLDGLDNVEAREEGTRGLLEQLDAVLERADART